MASYDTNQSSYKEAILASLLALGLGYVMGAGIEGDIKETEALKWALQTTKDCESSYSKDEYAHASECLKDSIERIEEERKLEARSEGHDPRQ